MHSHIDTDDYAASGIKVLTFPGGEPYAQVPAWPFTSVNIHAKLRTWNDLGYLIAVGSALSNQGVYVHVFAPYLPGLRQDRNPMIDGKNTPLTSRLNGRMFALFAASVTTVDGHSEAGLDHFRSGFEGPVRVITPDRFITAYGTKPNYVVIPDKGAEERATAMANALGVPVLKADKVRDPLTGHLSRFMVQDMVRRLPIDTTLLIADDICDGGGTFLGLAAAIEEMNKDLILDLFVTHGIFSNSALTRLLLDNGGPFGHIYTTDSYHEDDGDPDVTVLPLLPYYLGGLHP